MTTIDERNAIAQEEYRNPVTGVRARAERKALILDLIQQGLSDLRISSRLGCSLKQVRDLRRVAKKPG